MAAWLGWMPNRTDMETFGQLPWLVRHQPDRNIAIAQVSAEMALEGREASAYPQQ